MSSSNFGVSNFTSSIPYDLRQIYAVEIVGNHLKDIALARKSNRYPEYFNCLKDLWIVTQHKIKEKDKGAPEDWKKLIKEANEIFSYYPQEYCGKGRDARGHNAISNKLNEMEMFLYDKMEKAKLFGAKAEAEHLA